MSSLLKNIIRFILFILFQVVILNEVPPLHRFIVPYVYFLYLLWLPFSINRFLLLQRTAFQKPSSYFHHYKDLGPEEARETGRRIWSEINAVNLRENILPTRERAHVVLSETADHSIAQVSLRQL